MRFILKYLKPFYARMSAGLFIKIIGTLIELALPYILSHILKSVVISEKLSLILFWGGIMIGCALLACVCNIVANRMAAKVARDFSENVRYDLFNRTMRLSAEQTDKFTIPSLESRITTDTYNLHHFVGMMQRMGVRAPILLTGGIVITLIMDKYLALTMISVLPVLFGTVMLISKKGVPLYTKVQRSVDSMVRVVREDTQGIRVIKALSKSKYEHKRYDKVNRDLAKSERYAGMIMGLANPIMTLCMNGGIVAVVALSATRVANGKSDPETVIAFMQYFTLITTSMMAVTRIFMMYTKSSASAKRIAEVINTPSDLTIKSMEQYPDIETSAHIKFKDVNFSYSRRETLKNIDFEIRKGGTIGIIGATGSGKSTIINLLMRAYDVNTGSIYINGKDIRTYPAKSLHEMFGVALQSDFVYSDTIEENIRFGRNLTHEQIVKAAKIAQADKFITEFPDGYNHVLSQKGTNVSGGQRQRILIARAIAANPEILILDDSSSALDYKTDAALRQALSKELQSVTVVTVAQRVSSVKDADLILVIDGGKIIGKGTHEQLLKTCSEYKEIEQSQMGGDIVD
jgi:ATP-binding cassette subfamily B protein